MVKKVKEYSIVEAHSLHIDEIVEVHLKSFAGFYLAEMGAGFLRNYYQTVIENPESVSLVAVNNRNNRVVGFAVGFLHSEEFYQRLRLKKLRFFLPIALALIKKPRLLMPTIQNILYSKSEISERREAECELASLATSESSNGIGTLLLNRYCLDAKKLGARSITLTTDASMNERVINFYERSGFDRVGEFYKGKRRMLQLRAEL